MRSAPVAGGAIPSLAVLPRPTGVAYSRYTCIRRTPPETTPMPLRRGTVAGEALPLAGGLVARSRHADGAFAPRRLVGPCTPPAVSEPPPLGVWR